MKIGIHRIIIFFVLICEGECDQFGPKDHPYTRLLAQGQVTFKCENDNKNKLK